MNRWIHLMEWRRLRCQLLFANDVNVNVNGSSSTMFCPFQPPNTLQTLLLVRGIINYYLQRILPNFSSFSTSLSFSLSLTHFLTSVTRCLNYFSIFGHFHQWQLCSMAYNVYQSRFKILPDIISIDWRSPVRFCQTDEISPNLVTLIISLSLTASLSPSHYYTLNHTQALFILPLSTHIPRYLSL